jgi:hypothetical protein
MKYIVVCILLLALQACGGGGDTGAAEDDMNTQPTGCNIQPRPQQCL